MGAYGLLKNPISDDCFGDWIDDMWAPIHSLGHKMHEDPWTVEKKEVAAAGKAWLDIAYKNAEVCQFKKIGDDMTQWCLNNEAECFRWEGVFQRVAMNFWEILDAKLD